MQIQSAWDWRRANIREVSKETRQRDLESLLGKSLGVGHRLLPVTFAVGVMRTKSYRVKPMGKGHVCPSPREIKAPTYYFLQVVLLIVYTRNL